MLEQPEEKSLYYAVLRRTVQKMSCGFGQYRMNALF